MTPRLGYLQWLWEDCLKSLLCFIWSQLNISCITWCKSTSPGNVLTTGYAGILSQSVFVHQSQAEQEDSSQKVFCANDVFPAKCFSSEILGFSFPLPPYNGKTQTPLVGKCLTNTSTELWWGQLPTCLLPAFVSFYLKTVWVLLFWQEIAKKPRLHLNSAAACTDGSFEIIFI